MQLTCHAFRDTLKKLVRFVDRQPWMTDDDWWRFTNNPAQFLILADDATADRLWDLIKPRE